MCVVFTYFWHITFFGGCLALSGYAESQNRHSITCFPITPKSLAGESFLHGDFNARIVVDSKKHKSLVSHFYKEISTLGQAASADHIPHSQISGW
jgi:hypothetical protein